MGQWNAEDMVINYKPENPAADLRREHTALILPQLVELYQTFEEAFLLLETEELQRPKFAEISPFSQFHDVKVHSFFNPLLFKKKYEAQQLTEYKSNRVMIHSQF